MVSLPASIGRPRHRQLTKGFHFHGLPAFFFRLDSRRDIGLNADEESHVAGIIADRTQLYFAPQRRAVFCGAC